LPFVSLLNTFYRKAHIEYWKIFVKLNATLPHGGDCPKTPADNGKMIK
jgi:hypothetical protein